MSWFDDLSKRVADTVSGYQNTVNDYLKKTGVDQVVKIGQAAGGNRTAAEIAAGQYGSPPPIAPAAAAPATIANSASASTVSPFGSMDMGKILPIAAVGLIALMLLKKGRG